MCRLRDAFVKRTAGMGGLTDGYALSRETTRSRPRARAMDVPLELPAEQGLEPPGDRDERVEVDARRDAFALEEIHEILGRHVAGRARGIRAAAEPADGR